jgi:hypothetical protein
MENTVVRQISSYDTTGGSLRLSPKETGAKYLLLHSRDEIKTGRLLKLKETGPRIFSKQV